MKKIFAVSLMLLLSVMTIDGFSQNRAARMARRQANVQAQNGQIAQLIKNKTFVFIASEINSTMNPMLNNVQLSSLYSVWVTPSQFKAYLPIYGASDNVGQPSLSQRIDFYTSNYSYNVTTQGDGGWNVTINATDTWNINNYTFQFSISPDGRFCTLQVSSPFRAPVSFNGRIQSSVEAVN